MNQTLTLTNEWDKTFPKSENVNHSKVTFHNRYGITLAAAIDTRIKATVASTMYDMTRVTAKGYFDSEDNEQARYENRKAMNEQRVVDYKNGSYALGGGVVDPLPDDAPSF